MLQPSHVDEYLLLGDPHHLLEILSPQAHLVKNVPAACRVHECAELRIQMFRVHIEDAVNQF